MSRLPITFGKKDAKIVIRTSCSPDLVIAPW